MSVCFWTVGGNWKKKHPPTWGKHSNNTQKSSELEIQLYIYPATFASVCSLQEHEIKGADERAGLAVMWMDVDAALWYICGSVCSVLISL